MAFELVVNGRFRNSARHTEGAVVGGGAPSLQIIPSYLAGVTRQSVTYSGSDL